MRVTIGVGLVVLAFASACGLEGDDEPAGPLHGTSRAPDPVGEIGGAAVQGDLAGGSAEGADAASDPTPAATATLAQGLAITEIALFQGVKVSLAKSGKKVTSRTMPAIAGRAGLVRVYVTPDETWTARSVTAELHLVSGGKGLPIARETKTISVPSSETTVDSTFNFDLPGTSLPPGVEYFVQLLDATAPAVETALENPAQYPPQGVNDSMDVVSGADALKIVLVPVRYQADGSNRLPNTNAALIDAMKKRALELYPVPTVDITMHAPIDWATPIQPDGTGWSSVLAEVTQLRMQEKPSADTYYYGVFAPAGTVGTYCTQSCVLGLSNFGGSVADATQRASVGVLYDNTEVIGTMAHEVGHAHGRYHAPCGGAAGADPNYPYTNATIGTWGYSIVSKTLKNPNATTVPHDFMSYCGPEWTSDYTFKALFERGRTLKAANFSSLRSAPMVKRALRILIEDGSGNLSWHGAGKPAVASEDVLEGETRTVTYLAADGSTLGTGTAHRYGYDHLAGGSFWVPDGPFGTTRVVIAGAGSVPAP